MKALNITIAVLLVAFVAASAQAGVTINFAGIEYTNNDTTISKYLSTMYGSRVYCDDAEIRDNQDGDWPYWPGHGYYNNFCRVAAASGDMEMYFMDKPIASASGVGYVFDQKWGSDFNVYGYDKTFGSVEYPKHSALVNSTEVWCGREGNPFDWSINFDRPVSLLVISDSGAEDVCIDDLNVCAVPAPGAVLLGTLGAGIVGWLRRRKTL